MAYQTPSAPPATLVAGDTWSFTVDPGDYPPAEGWTGSFAFAGESDVTATVSTANGLYLVTVTSANSAGVAPGDYRWSAFATLSGNRYTIDSGTVRVLPNPAGTGTDQRTHAQKFLAAIESVLEGRVTADVEAYEVAGRKLTKIPMAELRALRVMYAAEVAAQRRPNTSRGVAVVFR